MASDTFNRANETPLAPPWVNSAVAGDLGPGANTLTGNAAQNVDLGLAYYTAAASSGAQYSETVGVGRDSGPGLRWAVGASAFNGYYFNAFSGTAAIGKITNGTATLVTNTGSTGIAGPLTFRLEANGSTLTAFIGGVQEATAGTDTTYTTGQPGMVLSSGASHAIDSWNGNDLTPPVVADTTTRRYQIRRSRMTSW